MPHHQSDVFHLLRLLSIPRIGPLKIRSLLNHFGSAHAVLQASPRDLIRVYGIDRTLASAIKHHEGERFAEYQVACAERLGVQIVASWDPAYPDLLSRIYDPPPLLFVQGTLECLRSPAIAVVGTRRPSSYGERAAERISRELVEHELTIISGLARGIDTVAHSAALRAHGRTCAVIGSGLDVPYPAENRRLMERIAESGAVISEFPLGTKPDAQNFPRRNRIISGIALGTIVVESAEDGGAMITASIALDQNREVFAVPGSMMSPQSLGPHRLIQTGRAKLIHSIEDVLDELQMGGNQNGAVPRDPGPLTLFEQQIYEHLATEPIHADDLADRSGLGPSDTLVTLLSLEFKGLVRQLPGKLFQRN